MHLAIPHTKYYSVKLSHFLMIEDFTCLVTHAYIVNLVMLTQMVAIIAT